MRILIAGVCGFVGSALAECLLERVESVHIVGLDNLMRPGAETNRVRMGQLGIEFIHGDLRSASDIAELPQCDWVIDAAANPSVLAGLSGEQAAACSSSIISRRSATYLSTANSTKPVY